MDAEEKGIYGPISFSFRLNYALTTKFHNICWRCLMAFLIAAFLVATAN